MKVLLMCLLHAFILGLCEAVPDRMQECSAGREVILKVMDLKGASGTKLEAVTLARNQMQPNLRICHTTINTRISSICRVDSARCANNHQISGKPNVTYQFLSLDKALALATVWTNQSTCTGMLPQVHILARLDCLVGRVLEANGQVYFACLNVSSNVVHLYRIALNMSSLPGSTVTKIQDIHVSDDGEVENVSDFVIVRVNQSTRLVFVLRNEVYWFAPESLTSGFQRLHILACSRAQRVTFVGGTLILLECDRYVIMYDVAEQVFIHVWRNTLDTSTVLCPSSDIFMRRSKYLLRIYPLDDARHASVSEQVLGTADVESICVKNANSSLLLFQDMLQGVSVMSVMPYNPRSRQITSLNCLSILVVKGSKVVASDRVSTFALRLSDNPCYVASSIGPSKGPRTVDKTYLLT